MNAIYAFTRIRLYRLHRKTDPINSPNAKFVNAELDFEPLEIPPLMTRLRSGAWRAFISFWRFLLGMKPLPKNGNGARKASRVQQLELNVTVTYYTQLLKDKEVLAAEVMNEYNEGFVYPRINPIRKDVAIMTHQSEVVNVWED
ncbi:hypothetical protein VNI00_003352 [Paramarasmius palmivorus]|uniref:Uncharacterized protein n=1 Tax=Paramarasmius palmivorus TaxID=297713 RepID=A0AAW0DSN5_9AGAR